MLIDIVRYYYKFVTKEADLLAEITLFNGEICLVDEDDLDLVSQYKWSATKRDHRRTIYARTNIKDTDGVYRSVRMHRLIMGLGIGDPRIVDHINGNGLDNRKSNLRICTSQQNVFNTRLKKNNTSGYIGVTFRNNRSVWVGEIRYNGKLNYVAYTKCKHYAARKYNDAARNLFGEFASLNKISECECIECSKYKKYTS